MTVHVGPQHLGSSYRLNTAQPCQVVADFMLSKSAEEGRQYMKHGVRQAICIIPLLPSQFDLSNIQCNERVLAESLSGPSETDS